ncbi:MAG: hypothetical protein HQK85_05900 [Nitrospinae bacterium]|nr:hypothetical protein [Nitrospinota bacterium]
MAWFTGEIILIVPLTPALSRDGARERERESLIAFRESSKTRVELGRSVA